MSSDGEFGTSKLPPVNVALCADRLGRLLDDLEPLRATSPAAEATYRRAVRLLLGLEAEVDGMLATVLDQQWVH
jgi:hypothetical protein